MLAYKSQRVNTKRQEITPASSCRYGSKCWTEKASDQSPLSGTATALIMFQFLSVSYPASMLFN